MLSLARKALGMEATFVSEFTGGRQVYREMVGDARSFGLKEGGSIALEGSYCQRVVDGRLPNAVPDAKNDERVKDLAVTHDADIGSYIGVPMRRSDGSLYGTLCGLSHTADPWMRDRDAKLLERFGQDMVRIMERVGRL